MKKHIPNFLTTIRIILAICFPFVDKNYWITIIIVAALTEWLDGVMARWLNAETKLGVILDPVADKLLLITTIFTFLNFDMINIWQLLLASLRDLTILSGTIWIIYKKQWPRFKLMTPLISGKIATFAQYLLFFNVIIYKELWVSIFVITTLVSAWAGWCYIQLFLKQDREYTKENNIT